MNSIPSRKSSRSPAFFKAMSDLWPFGAPIVGLGVPGVKQPLEGLIRFIVQCRELPKRHGL